MRYHSLRFDIWLCLLLSFLVSYIPVKIADKIIPNKYQEYVKEHTVKEGDIGGKATPDIFRVQSIADILEHETFTIVSPGIEYRNKGAGYHNGIYTYAVTLPSGEKVAVQINMDAIEIDGDYYSGKATLPIGKVVYEDLSKDESFLHQIEFREKLTRKDFYIDMLGKGGYVNEETYSETPKLFIQLGTIIIMFPIFHTVGAKLGIFPYFIAPKKKSEEKSEWE